MEQVTLKSVTELKSILTKYPVTVVDFSAAWCGPCKALSPQLDTLSQDPAVKVAKFIKIDVDESVEVAEAMNIQAMPTVIIFKGEKQVDNVIGANFDKIRAAVMQAVNNQ